MKTQTTGWWWWWWYWSHSTSQGAGCLTWMGKYFGPVKRIEDLAGPMGFSMHWPRKLVSCMGNLRMVKTNIYKLCCQDLAFLKYYTAFTIESVVDTLALSKQLSNFENNFTGPSTGMKSKSGSSLCDLCCNQRATDTIVWQTTQIQCGTPICKDSHVSCWTISNVTKRQSAYSCSSWLLQQMVRSISSANHRCPRNSQSLCGKSNLTLWCAIRATHTHTHTHTHTPARPPTPSIEETSNRICSQRCASCWRLTRPELQHSIHN